MITVEERFWSKVDKKSKDECWEWTAGTDKRYGAFWITSEGRMCKAHRVSYEIKHGPIPKGMKVCHHCDNTLCVNTKHLFLGTQEDNIMDAKNKGRLRNGISVGSMHGCSKLTEEQVNIILKDTRTHIKIAKDYNVERSTVSLIKQGKTWKHVRR